MTLQQIFDMTTLLYPVPSNWTSALQTIILNQTQRQIFRQLQIKGVEKITAVAAQVKYDLPAGVSKEFIEYIGKTTDTVIDSESQFIEYEYAKPGDNLWGRKWFDALNDTIGFYPTPDTANELFEIVYWKKPADLVSTTTTGVPELKADWHMILVYALIVEIAGSGNNPDVDMVNLYTAKYNALMREIMLQKYNSEPSYPVTRDVMKNKNRRARNNKVNESVIRNA